MSIRCSVLLLVGLLLLPALASAQTYGDGFAVGGVLLPSGAGTIVAKTSMGDDLDIEIEFGLATFSDGDYSSSDLSIGAGALFYTGSSDKFQPYWGARFRLGHESSDMPVFELPRADTDSDSHTTFGLVGVFGAEYFITKNLSFEGEAGIGAYFGSFSLMTETRLAGFIYL
jgi:opacity protein-like surface antigen